MRGPLSKGAGLPPAFPHTVCGTKRCPEAKRLVSRFTFVAMAVRSSP